MLFCDGTSSFINTCCLSHLLPFLLLLCCCPVCCCCVAAVPPQASAVRMTAADNLGQLTRLSARVEVLVADLANSAATAAEPDTAAAYLTALSGALAASGDRLTPPTLDKVQASLLTLYRNTGSRPSSTSGTVDPTAAALATALGKYCAVAGPSGMSAVLEAGPLGKGAQGSQQERELAAMLLAAVCGAAAAGLESAGLLKGAGEAAVRATRDPELVSGASVCAGAVLVVCLEGGYETAARVWQAPTLWMCEHSVWCAPTHVRLLVAHRGLWVGLIVEESTSGCLYLCVLSP